jgi:hypothetical protein
MRVRTLVGLMIALLLASPLAAQEQRGTIEGVVKDSSGAVLPGATVTAKSETGATLTTVSDDTGTFRFPSVAPATYIVTATLQGFREGEVKDVRVGLGQIKKLDFALGLATLTETVQVTSDTPLVDVKQSTLSLVTQAPGTNYEAKSDGVMIDGATAGENRYIIDGIETTDLRSGVSGQELIADFVEEVQVKSSGYTAEYGGSTGGVITGRARASRATRRRCASIQPTRIAPSTSPIRRTITAGSSPGSCSAGRSPRTERGSSAPINRRSQRRIAR